MANTFTKIRNGIGRTFTGAQQQGAAPTQAQAPPGSAQTPSSHSSVHPVQSDSVSLITYSPEELLQQVEQRRASVSFDRTGTATFMDNYNQVWSWLGPIIFALGTIGEIFVVLWGRQRVQDLLAGGSIVAVSMIAEGTLLGVSFSAKRLRNRADKRSSGWIEREKQKLKTLKIFWAILALGVAATQFAFILAQTKTDEIGTLGVIAIAVVRSLVALVADCYTAFASEEKPTSGDMALEIADKELQFTRKLLDQKALEVTTLNEGAIKVQETGIRAEIAQDNLITHKALERLKNQAQIETAKGQQEQQVLFDRMRNSAMRAIFDPQMPEEERHAVVTMLSALMNVQNTLPTPSTLIEEERTTDQLEGL